MAKHKVRQDKRDVTAARAQFSDFTLKRERAAGAAMKSAGIGAPNIFAEQVAEYDAAYETFTANMTDNQKGSLAAVADTYRRGILGEVSKFQAAEIVKADLGNMRTIAGGMGTEIYKGYRTIASAEADFRAVMDATSLGKIAKEALVVEQFPLWAARQRSSLVENPVEGAAQLASGELEPYHTPEELSQLRDDIIKRMNGAAVANLDNKMFEFMKNHPKAWTMVQDGTINSLESLEAYRGKVTNEVFNALRTVVVDRVIPKLSTAEIEAGESNAMSNFDALGITKDDSEADLQDILRFQNDISIAVAEGRLSVASQRRYFRQTERRAQQLMAKSGTGMLEFNSFIHTIDPFDQAADRINSRAKKENWDQGRKSRAFRELIIAADNYDLIPEEDAALKKEAGKRLHIEAFDNELRKLDPALADVYNIPDGVILPSGQILMASGSGAQKLKATVSPPPSQRVKTKPHPVTGAAVFWYDVLDEFNRPTGETIEVFPAPSDGSGQAQFIDADSTYIVQPDVDGPEAAATATSPDSPDFTEPVAGSVTVTPLGDDPDTLSGFGGKGGNVIPEDALLPGMPSGTKMYQDAYGNYYYRKPDGGASGLPHEAAAAILQSMELDKPLPLDPEVYGGDGPTLDPGAGAALEEKNKAQMDGGSGLISSANAATDGGGGTLGLKPDAAKPNIKPISDGVVDRVLSRLRGIEGTGDINADGTQNLTQGGTGDLGMTGDTKKRVITQAIEDGVLSPGGTFTDLEAAKYYLDDSYGKLNDMTGFSRLSPEVKAILLDMEYNSGTLGNSSYGKSNLKNDDESPTLAGLIVNGAPEWQILLKTLEFITQKEGKVSKINSGLVARRAAEYNHAAPAGEKITQIKTTKTGAVTWDVEFKRADGRVVFKRTGKLHKNSLTHGSGTKKKSWYPEIGSIRTQAIS